MNTTTCKGVGCGARIGFLRILATGRSMPVDPERVTEWLHLDTAPAAGGPRVTLVVEDDDGAGTVVTGQRGTSIQPETREITGYIPHFATCPAADDFRKRRS